MRWIHHDGENPHAAVGISRFIGAGGVEEWHVVIGHEGAGPDPAKALETQWLAALRAAGIHPRSTLMRRVFCSDVVNQKPQLDNFANAYPGAFSAIGQTPCQGGRFSMWSHHLVDPGCPVRGQGTGACFTLQRGALRHAWLSGLCDPSGADAAGQSRTVLARHDDQLAALGMTLGNDVIRTWWFVRDIDADYQALVDARKAAFDRHDLTAETHYIASTGIAGTHHETAARLSLDSYAIGGLVPGQVEHLSAPDHLGPTHMYGVTFERASAVTYADRRQVFLSGTASIDPSGAIVHPGDVLHQLDRTLDNIRALLAAAGGRLEQLAMILVYLRDPADGPMVDRTLRRRFPALPMVLLHAPVCRPGWLIELEGVAILPADEPTLPEF